MGETRRRERRRSRHARTLAQYAVTEAGTPTHVGSAAGVAPSTRLARIIRELRERRIDLHAEFRARRAS